MSSNRPPVGVRDDYGERQSDEERERRRRSIEHGHQAAFIYISRISWQPACQNQAINTPAAAPRIALEVSLPQRVRRILEQRHRFTVQSIVRSTPD